MRRGELARTVGLVGAGLLGLMLLGGVVTRAAADVIVACVATKSGAVRIVESAGSCDPKKETATQWNSLGSFDDMEGLACTGPGGEAGTIKVFEGSAATLVCVTPTVRFINLGSTVYDTQTNLMWEKKVAGAGCLHCVNDFYTWCNATGIAIGCAVTNNWIAAVNAEAFAGFTDWRVPTRDELATIRVPFPLCGTSPCIDPIFGPTGASFYWSATESDADGAWGVLFADGRVLIASKILIDISVRAVRGGP